MREFLPPLCFLLSIALVVVGFAVLSVDAPDASIDLHKARASGEDDVSDVLEADLRSRQFSRNACIGCAFLGSVLMTILGFKLMSRR